MSAGGGVPDLVVPVIDITSGATPVSPSRHNSRAKAPALRSVDDDLQLLAGSDDGHFEDVSADVDTAAVLDEAANSPTVGIRWAAHRCYLSCALHMCRCSDNPCACIACAVVTMCAVVTVRPVWQDRWRRRLLEH